MKIVVASDHRGFEKKRWLAPKLRELGHDVTDVGCESTSSCDYPDFAVPAARLIASGKADVGILLDNSGIGMSIAANKVAGVRAAVVHDELTAQLSRSHNAANVLCLSADLLGQRLIEKITEVWLASTFEGGRHARRIRKIEAMEKGLDPRNVSE